MKTHIFTLACLFTLISTTAFSQDAPANQDQASAATREMSGKLGLNESEYIKLKALNAERFARQAEINKMYGNDAAMRDKKTMELTNSYEAQLKAFLNQKQLQAYAAYKTAGQNLTAMKDESK